jgi:hypothetical protein
MRPVTYSWLAVVLGVACAAIGWLGLAGWIAVVVCAASVGGHVAGNAIGTRLREAADRDLARTGGRGRAAARNSGRGRAAAEATADEPLPPRRPPAQLQKRTSLGRLLPVSAAIGGVCGGVIGAGALLHLTSSSLAGALLGGVSSAVVGGLAGFLGASFVEIVRTSLREAIAAERAAATAEHR